MYLEHYGLGVNPFSLSPGLDFLYKSGAFEESIAHLVYGLDNSEAIVMITGAIGTGKTMALQSFLSNLGPGFYSALVTNTQIDATSFLKLVLEDLEVPLVPGSDKADLLIQFKNFLLEASLQRRRVIIVVDEAQNLEPEVLEEVRLLTNLGQGDKQPVQIILVGQPELEVRVNHESLAQLRQRIRVHYRLDSLSRLELDGYLNHRMAVAGCRERVFTARAIDRIFTLSRGIPRLVNSLAGSALLSAFVGDRRKVEARDVEELEPRQTAPAPTRPPAAVPAEVEIALKSLEPQEAPEPPEPVFANRQENATRPAPVLGILALIVVAIAAGIYIASYFGTDLGDLRGILPLGRDDTPGSVANTLAADPSIDSVPVIAADPTPVTSPPDEPVAAQEQSTADMGAAAVEKPPVTAATPMAMSGDPYFIHVVSFRERLRADEYVDSLRTLGREAVTKHDSVFGNDWFRVWLGPFPDEKAARSEIVRLQSEENLVYYSLQRASDVPGS